MLQQYCKQYDICRESFRIVQKLSRRSGKFPDGLESFQTGWKVSGPDSVESFRTVWNVLDSLERFQTVWKLSRRSGKLWTVWNTSRQWGKFLDSPESYQTVRKVVCRKSDLRTFGAYMSQKRFTHSVRKVFAREILPTGKFWLFVSLVSSFSHVFLNFFSPNLF